MASQVNAGVHNPAQSIASVTAELLKSGRYSDIIIKCHGKVFKVHRNIVAVQSKPLAAAIDGAFKEAKTGVTDLEDDDPKIIEKFIDFLYTRQYDDGSGAVDSLPRTGSQRKKHKGNTFANTIQATLRSNEALNINTALYVAGEKYDVAELKKLAKEKYESAVSAAWNCASFTSSLKLLYTETPETDRFLKDIAMEAAASHVKELVKNPEFVDFCKRNGGIGVDVLKACFLPSSEASAFSTATRDFTPQSVPNVARLVIGPGRVLDIIATNVTSSINHCPALS